MKTKSQRKQESAEANLFATHTDEQRGTTRAAPQTNQTVSEPRILARAEGTTRESKQPTLEGRTKQDYKSCPPDRRSSRKAQPISLHRAFAAKNRGQALLQVERRSRTEAAPGGTGAAPPAERGSRSRKRALAQQQK
jgi:hypothetical protein